MKNKHKIIALGALLPFFLASCGEEHMGDITSVTEKLTDFNVWDFLITFLAFVVLLIIVFFFGYKPVKEVIQKRKEYVNSNIKEAEDRELKSRGLVDEAKETLEKSKKTALEIVESSKETALKEKEKILLSAKEEAKREIDKAHEDIKREIEAEKDNMHKEIVDVALKASEELLQRELNTKDNKRLLDDFVSEIENKDK